jgi:hypothetical protein
MIEQCIATNVDVFCMGVVLGIMGLKLSEWLIKFLDLYLGNKQKELDLKFAEAITKMKERFEKTKENP